MEYSTIQCGLSWPIGLARNWRTTASTQPDFGARSKAWVVQGGIDGQDEAFCFDNGVSAIAWGERDFSNAVSKEWLREQMEELYGESYPEAIPSFTTQVWRFVHEISEGDLIVIPQKVADTRVLAIGTVQGECTFTPSEEESRRHQRPVDWRLMCRSKSSAVSIATSTLLGPSNLSTTTSQSDSSESSKPVQPN